MELILTKDVEDVGKKGDVVRVKPGFARNFLLPQSLAIAATRTNRAFVQEQKARAEKRHEQERKEAAAIAEKVAELKIVISAKVGEKGKLFGSVTNEEICASINEKGYQFKKKQIHLKDPIRAVGTFQVVVDVYPEVKAKVSVEIVQQ